MEKKESKLSLGIALVLLGGLLIIGHLNPNDSLTGSISNEPINITGLSQTADDAVVPEKIIIPSVNIDLEVKRSPIENGYWVVYEDSAAWGEDSGTLGKPGNVVVFAHAREGQFLPLKDIKANEPVYLIADSVNYEYLIMEIKEVFPDEIEVVAPTTDETLTLYTCSGFQDEKRLIVVAKRVYDS